MEYLLGVMMLYQLLVFLVLILIILLKLACNATRHGLLKMVFAFKILTVLKVNISIKDIAMMQ
jgi:hypothetical protein